jgi:23S rRNA (pseudouridine1915-N3)-methyltransferase
MCSNSAVKLKVCWIGKTKDPSIEALTAEYCKRLGRYVPTEYCELRSERALLEMAAKERSRPMLVLLDARGKQMTSEELAQFLRRHQDGSRQTLMFAIGPADGWTDEARRAASDSLSLGKMTLAHEIARVVLVEQLYRGFTIIAGHPYHLGHK